MPFALSQFSAEAFSLWMIFVIFYGLVVVFDFGLTTTIARQYNFILAGANSIEKSGLSSGSQDGINEVLFTQLYSGSKKIFTNIALGVSVLLLLVYLFYLQLITVDYQGSIIIEWILYSLAIIISLFCLTYNAIFFGTHNVASIYRVCSISNLVFFATSISLILFEQGLLSIAIARCLSAFVYFFHAKFEIQKFNMLLHYKPEYKMGGDKVLKNLVPNAAKLGGVTLGNFLVSKASVLIVAAYFPLEESGAFSLTLNIFSVIMSVSLLFMTIKTPKLNTSRQEKRYGDLFFYQKRIRLVCLLIAAVAFITFILLGESLLRLIGSNTELPPLSVLFVFSVLCFFEINRSISMNFIMSSNNVPFLKPVLITGIFCLVLTIGLFELGYAYIIIPVAIQLMMQSLFNNWYWTKQEIKEYKVLSKKGDYE